MKLVIDGIEIRDVGPLDGPYSVSTTIHLSADTSALDAWIASLFDLCPFLALGWAARWRVMAGCRPVLSRRF